jgi:hypothetical protein
VRVGVPRDEQIRNVEKYFVHRDYEPKIPDNNIALLKLNVKAFLSTSSFLEIIELKSNLSRIRSNIANM